ncbi:hypothetical protein GHK61_31075 [Sinorhizobium meliloti]|nr:hypothetical protein [Sinorhizobium meliloti]MQX55124.1 hypothetical protein [Sinorhizobium meliloti]MQX60747.1 hypothetical protein [Sinorhizobium meliloti]
MLFKTWSSPALVRLPIRAAQAARWTRHRAADQDPQGYNSIELPWSNGQAEGQINRLKTIKRAMYVVERRRTVDLPDDRRRKNLPDCLQARRDVAG